MADIDVTKLSSITLESIFSKVDSFVSLDISVRSTGWVCYKDRKISHGVLVVPSKYKEDVVIRRIFREGLLELFGGQSFEYMFIEDTIHGVNFKTTKILSQLNGIPDDLIDSKLIDVGKVIRVNNKVWKKNLKIVSNYVNDKSIKRTDKAVVRNSIGLLGYDNNLKQDVLDALGMACGVIYDMFMKPVRIYSNKNNNIMVGYTVRQFDDYYAAMVLANDVAFKQGRKITSIDIMGSKRGIIHDFKGVVVDYGDDDVFVIQIQTLKLGALALKKNLDLSFDDSVLVVYRNKKGRG